MLTQNGESHFSTGNRSYWNQRHEKKLWERRLMSQIELLRLWIDTHVTALNRATLPIDINELPCGCKKSADDLRHHRQLHVYRFEKGEDWHCSGCDKPLQLPPPEHPTDQASRASGW